MLIAYHRDISVVETVSTTAPFIHSTALRTTTLSVSSITAIRNLSPTAGRVRMLEIVLVLEYLLIEITGSNTVSLPDLRTENSDVASVFNTWIAKLVSDYSSG
jgi:hypothetical protein